MINRVVSAVFYYLIILPISALPYFILYRISDFLCFLFYRVLGYRKKVIVGNIERSFPKKSKQEHLEIAKKFYAHFCDLIMESLKVFTISKSQVQARMKFLNPEVMNKYFNQGRSVIMAGGHFNNWELFAVGIDDAIQHNSIAIYKPLSNQFFDAKMRSTRGKYGLRLIPISDVKKVFDETKHEVSTFIFGTDQSPGNVKKAYWMNFLNQETAVLFGAEKFAKDYNYPVVFCCIHKAKRGFYEVEFRDLVDDPSSCEFGVITQLHTMMLEKDILNAPQFWLWSHRRWKKKRPEGAELHKSI